MPKSKEECLIIIGNTIIIEWLYSSIRRYNQISEEYERKTNSRNQQCNDRDFKYGTNDPTEWCAAANSQQIHHYARRRNGTT